MEDSTIIKQIESAFSSIKDQEQLKRIVQWVVSRYGNYGAAPIYTPIFIPYVDPQPYKVPDNPVIPYPYTTWCSNTNTNDPIK